MKKFKLFAIVAIFLMTAFASGAWAQDSDIAADNIVTKDNFYSFFDEYGNLLDAVTFDKLVFKGEFADLASYITLDRAITVTGDNAVLNDIAFIVASEGVTIENMTMIASSNLGNLIDIAGENAVIKNMNITYTVDEAATAITVRPGANGVQILKDTIHFESTVRDYATDEVTTAICVNSGVSIFDDEDPIEGLVIDSNKITVVIPAFLPDVYENEYYVMGLSAVNGVRINGAEGFEFKNNTLDVTTNRLARTLPTLQALYVASSSGLISEDSISMIDSLTPAGKDVYLYAVELVNDEDLTISNNIFNLSTAGGKAESGAADAILAIASEFEVTGNSITTVSNGPNIGIYFPAHMGSPCDAVIKDNFISVTGLATSEHNYGLVSGIEIETGDVEISRDTIYTYNIGEYAEGNYIYGISYAQDGSVPEVVITDNIVITEGHYAISFLEVDQAGITENILRAHELTGDDAVYIESESDYTVEDNLRIYTITPGSGIAMTGYFLTVGKTAENTYYFGKEGDIITLTITTPPEGFNIGTVKYNDGTDDYIISPTNNVYSFEMPASDVTVSYSLAKSLTSEDITIADIPDQTWTGLAICPAISITDGETALIQNTDYTVVCSNNIYTGTATMTITGAENYVGTIEKTFKIEPQETKYGAVKIFEDQTGKRADVDGSYEGPDAVRLAEAIPVNTVTFKRAFSTSGYSTIVLPFDVYTDKLTGIDSVLSFGGIVPHEGKKAVGMNVVWERSSGHVKLQANTPYMLKMNESTLGIEGPVTLVPTEAAVTEDNGWEFRGVYAYTAWPEEGHPDGCRVYGFAGNSNDEVSIGEFVKFEPGSWLHPLRVYLINTNVNCSSRSNRPNMPAAPAVASAEEQLPDRMDVVIIDRDEKGEEHTMVIGHFNTRTGEIKPINVETRIFDLKGRNVQGKANARGAYYGKKLLNK